MFNLENCIALLTGATGGIGKAIASTLIKAGATVLVSGTSAEKLDLLVKELGPKSIPIQCNLKDKDELNNLFIKAESLAGNIDILVCNAGINMDNLAMRMKDEEWNEVINLNLTATFKLNQAAIKSMMRNKYGRIINISSIIGCTGNFGQANYAATKAGMIAMSKSIALEVATRNITVNCIAPGFIDTRMTYTLNDEIKAGILKRIPMGRTGSVEEVASAVLFLASKEGSYITGHTLHVNGGMFMA